MNDIFCTYFDHNYLSRATVMIESLRRFERRVPIYILTLSGPCEAILRELALPNVEIVPLAELEAAYPELLSLKSERKLIEYYFTLSPFLPHYLFAQTTADRINYIDGDLYFFTSPQPVLDSLGEASVAITPHRFSFEYRNHVQYGLFNVAWITYRRCAEGLDCLNAYKADCTDWCYDRVEDGRFGDQKYLDGWPGRYPNLRIIDHKGFNLAIWNAHNYMIRAKNDTVMIDDDPLVFYHFASTKLLPDGTVEVPVLPRGGRSKTVLIEHVLNPYKRVLEDRRRILQQRFPALAVAQSDIRYPPAALGVSS
ncbi:MAG: hypothetical protein WBV65_21965 [Xanthobacteraceae bacterium]